MSLIKKTPFYKRHIENSGKVINFNGWALPVEYKSVLQEAKNVRNHCGLFDASHMGEIVLNGPQRFNFLQSLVTNDLGLVKPGKMQYNLILNQQGGAIDDLMVYNLENSIFCVVNASNKDNVLNWFKDNLTKGVQIIDKSQEIALIVLQGPDSSEVIKKVFGEAINDLEYMQSIKISVSKEDILISRSGYTGEDGFEVYVPADNAEIWWDKITEAGKLFQISLCGLGSRDILRIEAGYPLYGCEISQDINPYEAALGWAVKLYKNFIGKTALLKIKNAGILRTRVGFIMQDKAIPRHGYMVYADGRIIGQVSSGTYSPNTDNFIGMASVEQDGFYPNKNIDIEVRGRLYKAKITNFPFVAIKTRKQKITQNK